MHKFFSIFGNYGVAIVVLTILVKAVLFPLNSVSFRNMKAMQDLQPEIQRLREQYKDPQQQQQQIMSLYKRKNVNPLGGCFPMLLQLPIFIGLFSALRLSVELRHAHFAFWINDLSATERLEVFGFGVPVMVVLFVASMVIQQWTMPSTMDATQKKIMMVVPVLFGFMFASFPAGLTLYFLINNLISIGQQRALQTGGDAHAVKVTSIVSVALFLLAILMSKLG
jgi:YidC/Oxa1 family membrane protein insertase